VGSDKYNVGVAFPREGKVAMSLSRQEQRATGWGRDQTKATGKKKEFNVGKVVRKTGNLKLAEKHLRLEGTTS